LARKFSDSTLVKVFTSKITKPFLKTTLFQVQSSLFKIDVNPPLVTDTSILEESANADDVISLESSEDWCLNN